MDNDRLIAAFHRFKAESQRITNEEWPAFNKRADKFVILLKDAGLESYYLTALQYWDAAGKRTLKQDQKR